MLESSHGGNGETRDPVFDYLRTGVVFLVVVLHAALAYTSFSTFDPAHWRAASAPVVDSVRWPVLDPVVGYLDSFLMALMFFVSGLFVLPSLRRRGSRAYVVSRLKRLGLPFLAGILVIAPVAFYPSFLMADPSPERPYLATFFTTDGWPVGPPWFLWVLLLFDGAAAAMYRLRPKATVRRGRQPGPAMFILASLAGLLPPVLLGSHYWWFSAGPFDLQPVRLGQYFAFFLLGAAAGSRSSDGFGRRKAWGAWAAAGFLAFLASWAIGGDGTAGTGVRATAGGLFALATACSVVGVVAAMRKLVQQRRPLFDDLSSASFGIFLLHYPVVLWMQFTLLEVPGPAWAKFIAVSVAGFVVAWGLTKVFRVLREVVAGARPIHTEPRGHLIGRRIGTDALKSEKSGFRRPSGTGIIIMALVSAWAVFAVTTGGLFLSSRNLSNLLRQTTVLGLAAMGLQFVMVSGKIDLAVGVLAGFVSLFAPANQSLLIGRVLPRLLAGSGVSSSLIGVTATVITVACCLAIGLLVGLYQGWLIGIRGLPALLVSFANSFLLLGLLPLALLGGSSAGLHASFVYLGQGYLPRWAGWAVAAGFLAVFISAVVRNRRRREAYGLALPPLHADLLKIIAVVFITAGGLAYVADGYRGLPVPVLLLLAMVGLLSHLLSGTRFGVRCVAMGYSASVAAFSGVNVRAQIVKVYALSGTMAACAGIVLAGYTSFGSLNDSVTLTYSALAACLIGLTAASRDRGSVIGAVIGALLLGSLDNWMVLTDVAPYIKELLRGFILIGVAYIASRTDRGLKPVLT